MVAYVGGTLAKEKSTHTKYHHCSTFISNDLINNIDKST